MINWPVIITGIIICIIGLIWLRLTVYFVKSTKEAYLKELYKSEWITKIVLSILIFIGGLALICYQLFPIVFRDIKPEGTYYVEDYNLEAKYTTSLDKKYTYDYEITAKLSNGSDYTFSGCCDGNIVIDKSTSKNYIIVSHQEFSYGIDDVAIFYVTPETCEELNKIEKEYMGWVVKKKTINN